MRELVLASTSPFRRRMLQAAGLSFSAVAPEVDESVLKRELASAHPPAGASDVAAALARAKALAISARMPSALVIGADQVLALGEELFDKPGDLARARDQLQHLRGKPHQLHTAAALAEGGDIVWSRIEVATLYMRSFSDAYLDAYLAEAGPASSAPLAATRSRAAASSCSSASRATTSPSSACRSCRCWPSCAIVR